MKELLKKQTLIVLLMAVVASFAFVSCGDDDDDDGGKGNSAIVGTWSETYDDEGDYYTVTFIFNSDGTFQYSNKSWEDDDDSITHEGTYEYNSKTNQLVCRNIDGGTGVMYWTCKISGKTMYLTDDRDGESFRLTKK